ATPDFGSLCGLKSDISLGPRSASTGHCRHSLIGGYGIFHRGSCGSLGLNVSSPDHLAPLLGFLGDQLSKVGGRAGEQHTARISELSLQLGIGEGGIDLLVELVDDPGRRVCRCAEAEISA